MLKAHPGGCLQEAVGELWEAGMRFVRWLRSKVTSPLSTQLETQ